LYCVRDVEAYTAQTIYHHAVLLDYSGCKRDRSPEICTSHTCYSARWVLDQYGLKKIPSKNFKVSRGSENWDTSDLQTQTVGIFTDSVSAGMQSPQAPFVCPSVCTEWPYDFDLFQVMTVALLILKVKVRGHGQPSKVKVKGRNVVGNAVGLSLILVWAQFSSDLYLYPVWMRRNASLAAYARDRAMLLNFCTVSEQL